MAAKYMTVKVLVNIKINVGCNVAISNLNGIVWFISCPMPTVNSRGHVGTEQSVILTTVFLCRINISC